MAKPNYRIIRIEKKIEKSGFLKRKTSVRDSIVTMVKFYAKDDESAYKYLQEYKKAANCAYDYYYDKCNTFSVTDRKGNTHEFEDILEAIDFNENSISWYKKAFNWLALNLELYLTCYLKDAMYQLKTNWHLLKNKHQVHEYWDLSGHILNDIKWNVPIINNCRYAISKCYIDKAICELHKDDKDFDINAWNSSHNFSYTDEEEALALKLQQESRNKLLNHIKLYEYYSNFGVTDDKEFDAKWHHTLPIKKGTYDEFEQDKLDKLIERHWNAIWEWMRKEGNSLQS